MTLRSRDHHENKRGRGRAPRILGPTSARHFCLLPLAFIPTTATAHPIEFLPRQPRRTTGGPPVLHGFPPAPHRTICFHQALEPQLQQMFETDLFCNPPSQTPNETPRLFFRSQRHVRRYATSSPTTVPSALPTAATSNLSRFSRANSSAFTCTTLPRRSRASSQPRRS